MKKLLACLGFITLLTASSITGVVSAQQKQTYKSIYVITSGVNIFDGSFNESSFRGANNFLQLINKDENKQTKRVGYAKPKNTISYNLESAYATAVKYGAENLILPSFVHGGSNINLSSKILKDVSKQKNIKANGILVDNLISFKDEHGNNQFENMIGLSYKMEVATLFAGLASIGYYFNKYSDETQIKLSTFGGMSNPFAVDNFMVGFLTAIEVFNSIWSNNKYKSEFAKLFNIDEKRNLKASRINYQSDKISAENFNGWYSNNFEPGKAMAISEKLVSNGSNIILPVSGPQITDLLSVIKNEKRNNVYVVGVDIDIVTTFPPAFSKIFITSALKPLAESTFSALAHTDKYINKNYDPLVKNSKTQTQHLKENDLEVTSLDGNPIQGIDGVWTQKNLWFTGSIATKGNKYSNDNKITKNQYTGLKQLFKRENVTKMSAMFYKHFNESMGKYPSEYDYLNDIFTTHPKKLSQIIIGGENG